MGFLIALVIEKFGILFKRSKTQLLNGKNACLIKNNTLMPCREIGNTGKTKRFKWSGIKIEMEKFKMRTNKR